ncbi:MAG TPA: glycosyltransferase [Thermoplasmata archaeon]|nr:glycosyltransferase [Thermoplasmata archaeon]
MKIALFTDSYLPTVDGVVTSLLMSKRELEKLGHEVVVFAPQIPGNGCGRSEDVIWVRAREFRAYPGYRLAIFPGREVEQLEEIGADIVHSHGVGFMGIKGLWSAWQCKRPLVLTFHTMIMDAMTYYTPFHLDMKLLERGLRLYLRVFLHRCRAVVVPTRSILQEIEELAPHMRLTDVIPTGVDANRYRPDVDGSWVRERWGFDGNEVVLHVGRLAYEKNLPTLVDAFARLKTWRPDAKLMLVGRGPSEPQLRTLVRRRGLEKDVVFTGFVPDADLPAYYAACDAFAIPSKFETQALVVLEAMASGKPVAGVNYRAIPEFVRDGKNGYLFQPDDAQGAATAIDLCLEDRAQLGKAARETAEMYTVEATTRRLVRMYEALLSTWARPA